MENGIKICVRIKHFEIQAHEFQKANQDYVL